MKRKFASDAVVDGQVVGRTTSPISQSGPPVPGGPDITLPPPPPGPMTTPEGYALADTETKARAVILFIKVPFFAYCALNDRLPPLVRIGAALLGVYEVRQLTRSTQELTQVVSDAQAYLPQGV